MTVDVTKSQAKLLQNEIICYQQFFHLPASSSSSSSIVAVSMFRSSYGLGRNIQQIVHPSKNNLSSLASPVAPLLNLSGYTTPASFLAQTNVAISQCVSLRSDLLSSVNSFDFDNSNNQTNETYPNLILNLHRLDSISNSICSVIDLAELIRNVHKCPEWREKANESFSVLYGFISELNTDVELYNAVKKIEEVSDRGRTNKGRTNKGRGQ